MNKKKKLNIKQKQKIAKYLRIVVQVLFFIFAPSLFSQSFSGVKESFSNIGSGSVLVLSDFVVRFLVLSIITVVFGRIFCGWACAFGAFGDWVYYITDEITKVFKKKSKKKSINKNNNKNVGDGYWLKLQWVKYIVLILILVLCFIGKSDIVTKYSPWTIFSLITARNFHIASYIPSFAVMLVVIIGMAIKERFFCQVLCPLGAIFSILPRIPFLSLKRKGECLKGCSLCKNNCPVLIKLGEDSLKEGECINCLRCAATCPKGNIGI